jgi:hypothetical protein
VAIRQALASDGLTPGMDPATLVVLQMPGSYSGCRVTYFRVFDPVRADHPLRAGGRQMTVPIELVVRRGPRRLIWGVGTRSMDDLVN